MAKYKIKNNPPSDSPLQAALASTATEEGRTKHWAYYQIKKINKTHKD